MNVVITEKFDTTSCEFYKDDKDAIWLTREQIGKALGYANPAKAIQKIHLEHKDRLDKFSIQIKEKTLNTLNTRNRQGSDLGVVEGMAQPSGSSKNNNLQSTVTYYSQRGVMEICRWSEMPRANDFMDWVYDVIDAYRRQELISVQKANELAMNQMNNISARLLALEEKRHVQGGELSDWHLNTIKRIDKIAEMSNRSSKNVWDEIIYEFADRYRVNMGNLRRDFIKEYPEYGTSPSTLFVIEYGNYELKDGLETILYDMEDEWNINTYHDDVAQAAALEEFENDGMFKEPEGYEYKDLVGSSSFSSKVATPPTPEMEQEVIRRQKIELPEQRKLKDTYTDDEGIIHYNDPELEAKNIEDHKKIMEFNENLKLFEATHRGESIPGYFTRYIPQKMRETGLTYKEVLDQEGKELGWKKDENGKWDWGAKL